MHKVIEKGLPLDQAKKAVILIHGRGATAEIFYRSVRT